MNAEKPVWSQTNLNVTTFVNGDMIHEAKTTDEWIKCINEKIPAWCNYDNKPENGEKYGKLYNFHAVSDPRGLAPEGWRIPNEAEWNAFRSWVNVEGVDNIKGFNGLPAGKRDDKGNFSYLNNCGYWWSSTEKVCFTALFKGSVYSVNPFVEREPANMGAGLSVRCIK